MKRSLLVLPILLALAVSWPTAAAHEPPRLEDEPWVVKRVSRDGRTLLLYALRGGCDPEPSARVTETAQSVAIEVRHVAPAGPGPCPAIAIYETVRVRLAAPIAGRALVGQSLREVPFASRRHAPRVRGLAPADARFALRAHGFRPRCPELRAAAKGDGRRERAGHDG